MFVARKIPFRLFLGRDFFALDSLLVNPTSLLFAMSALKNLNQEKAAQLLFVLFFVYALWEQFAPQPEPGLLKYNQAKTVMKANPTPEEEKQACNLFARAVQIGSKDAAFGLSDCVAKSLTGTALQRNSIRYALLTLAMDARHETRSARNERDALGLTDAQKKEALKLDVLKILSGDVSALDFSSVTVAQ